MLGIDVNLRQSGCITYYKSIVNYCTNLHDGRPVSNRRVKTRPNERFAFQLGGYSNPSFSDKKIPVPTGNPYVKNHNEKLRASSARRLVKQVPPAINDWNSLRWFFQHTPHRKSKTEGTIVVLYGLVSEAQLLEKSNLRKVD